MMQTQTVGSHLIAAERHQAISKSKRDQEKFPALECLQEALPQKRPPNKKKKRVSFSTVEIREHAVILGDHANCQLPLALDWKRAKRSIVVNVEHYEDMQQRYGRRRHSKLVRMDVYLRKIRLKHMGYSTRELNKAERQFEIKSRRQRASCPRYQRTKWQIPQG